MFLLKIAQIPIGVAKTTYTTWPKEKNILPSSKQKLICFRTIEQVGKAQYNISKLCLISISHIPMILKEDELMYKGYHRKINCRPKIHFGFKNFTY